MTGDRCGYTPGRFAAPLAAGGVDPEEYFEAAPTCCWRPVWDDRDRCVWHAEDGDKPVDALVSARTDGSERLDGAVLVGCGIRDRVSFADCSLREADLKRADLTGADLSNADLVDTNLNRADLSGADLSGADLSGAFVTAATLTEATLTYARLSDVNLSYSTMQRATLLGADFVDETGPRRGAEPGNAELIRVDLSGADLSYARLEGTDLTDAKLRGADLSVSFLGGADLTDADLSGANLWWADLEGAVLTGATLSAVNLSDAWVTGTSFSQASFSDVKPSLAKDPEQAEFAAADFSGNDFRNDDLSGLSLPRADFTDTDLYGTDFSRATLIGAVFDGANCRGVDFGGADLEGASFVETDLRSAELDDATVYRATFADCEMNVDTSIEEVDRYRPGGEERGLSREQERNPSRGRERNLNLGRDEDPEDGKDREDGAADARSSQGTERDEPMGRSGGPREARIRRLERVAWVHRTIHRQLIRSGRVRDAVRSKHYIDEQNAKIAQSWLERDPIGFLNLQLTKGLILVSESPPHLLLTVGVTAAVFGLAYPFVGGIREASTATLYTADDLTIPVAVRLFLFSLTTILEGAYSVVEAPLGPFVPLETFEPLGALIEGTLGVATLTPEGAARGWATVERALGALLLVPFSMLVIQRLRLYVGSSTDEEGIGGGFVSWFLGR